MGVFQGQENDFRVGFTPALGKGIDRSSETREGAKANNGRMLDESRKPRKPDRRQQAPGGVHAPLGKTAPQ